MGERLLTAGPGGVVTTPDLPRFNKKAIIGDKRNDENAIVSQLQGVFLQFHNVIARLNPSWSFEDVRQSVQWHYQWLVLYDYLPRIVGREMVESILLHIKTGTSITATPPRLRFYKWEKSPALPVEFSGAAYRFGHTMVRPQYRLSSSNSIGLNGRLPVFEPPLSGPGLNGFDEVPLEFGIQWPLFFETNGRRLEDHNTGAERIQPAYKIDTSLVFPLMKLPEFSDLAGNPKPPAAVNILALRNLRRGMMLSLPSGQAVAQAMGEVPLKDKELLVGKADDEHFAEGTAKQINDDNRTSMQDSAPLWFYILAEARHRWKLEATKAINAAGPIDDTKRKEIINRTPTRLGPVGGRIVAETLIGIALGDKSSFLNAHHTFTPIFGKIGANCFDAISMGDLTEYVKK